MILDRLEALLPTLAPVCRQSISDSIMACADLGSETSMYTLRCSKYTT